MPGRYSRSSRYQGRLDRADARVGERPDAQPVPRHVLDSFNRHFREHLANFTPAHGVTGGQRGRPEPGFSPAVPARWS